MHYEMTFERTDGVLVMTSHIVLPLVTGILQHEKAKFVVWSPSFQGI
jgi:cytochrome b